jgi:hypothetical protein
MPVLPDPTSPGFGQDIGWRGDNNDLSSNPTTLSVSIALCLIVALVFEIATHHLETNFKKRNKILYSILLHRLFRQITVVGVLALLLTVIGNGPNFPDLARKLGFAGSLTNAQMYRYVHYMQVILAILVLAFVLFALMLTYLSEKATELWKRYQGLGLEGATERLNSYEKMRSSQSFFSKIAHHSSYREVKENFYFLKMRQIFLQQHGLTDSYDFKGYLDRHLINVAMRLLTIPWYAWLVFTVIGIIQCLRQIFVKLPPQGAALAYMVVGWILLLAVNLVLYKVAHSISAFCDSMGTENEGLIGTEPTHTINDYIWFKRPRFTETALQVIILGMVMFVTLFFMELSEAIAHKSKFINLLLSALAPILLMLATTPYTLAFVVPQLSIISGLDKNSTASLINPHVATDDDGKLDYLDVLLAQRGSGNDDSIQGNPEIVPTLAEPSSDTSRGARNLLNMPPPQDYSHVPGDADPSTPMPSSDPWPGLDGAVGPSPAALSYSADQIDVGAELEGLFEYNATGDSQVSFPAGAHLEARGKIENDWVLVRFGGAEGYVPAAYVKCIGLPA